MTETADASTEDTREDVMDQTEYQLSVAQWEVFCCRLDDLPKVVPALRQLFLESKPAKR